MATRITYPIFQEDTEGRVIFKKDVDVSTDLTYKKNGGAYTPGDSGNNGDGTYYFTITESADYSVLLKTGEQDEFKEIYCAAEDSLSQQNLATVPTRGQVKLSGTDLEIEDAATMILEADIVNDLTTGGITKPLSAEQGKTLKTAQDLKLAIANIVNNYTSTDTDKAGSANMIKTLYDMLTLNFASEEYIDDSKTISQNFEIVDKKIAEGFGDLNIDFCRNKMVYNSYSEAAGSSGNECPLYTSTDWDEDNTTYKRKLKVYFSNDTVSGKVLYSKMNIKMYLSVFGCTAALAKLVIKDMSGSEVSSNEFAIDNIGQRDAMILSIPQSSAPHYLELSLKINDASGLEIHVDAVEIYLSNY